MTSLGAAPRLSVLRDEDEQRIHSLALQVLERAGVVMQHPRAIEVFARSGAATDAGTGRIWIPRSLVAESLEIAPSAFTVRGQSPDRDTLVSVDGGRLTRPATGLNWILDSGARTRRPVTAGDLVDWVRVSQALSNLDFCASAFDQMGDPGWMEVRAVAAMLTYSDKPLMVSGLSGEGIRYVRRLCDVAQGAARGPRAVVLTSANSPLLYDYGQVDVALAAAEEGIPVVCNSSPVSGVTAPVTAAGQLALMHAEILGWISLLELYRPGAPVIYAPYPNVLDMKSGSMAFGSPKTSLLGAAGAQLGRAHGLPTSSNGLTTDACTPDQLAVSEKWLNGYPAFVAGASINGGAGALASQGTISLEQLVVDDHLYAQMRRHAAGIVVDDDALAAELIIETGPGGSYLEAQHTLAFMRDEHWTPPLANRLGASAWEAAGCRDTSDRAREAVKTILASRVVMLSDAQQREAALVLKQAGRDLAGLMASRRPSLASDALGAV